MASRDSSYSTHLIDGDGIFNVAGIETFMKEVKLAECGLSYALVSIMGPQSSGKSTLLNNLFGTNFREMDAFKGRSQTTKGIWMARCAGIEPCTLVMDLEGTDGRERGEDDTAFEKQSALFALAVSDIVLINMWCHDIGREQAANKPLLKTVFQTPLENLEPVLREDIQKIWDSVPKPQAHMETPLSEFFNVEVVALSSYEEKEEQFREQVANLRQRFHHSIAPGGLAGDRRGVVPASGFSFSSQQIWKVIKENKDLDLPAHKVMVATVRCEEIANEKYAAFAANEEWCKLEETVQSGPITGFGKKLNSLLDVYDAEAIYFDEGVRSAKQKQLQEKLLQLVQPAFQSALGHVRSGTLDKFKETFDKALERGEGFSEAANNCIEFCMAQFDKACADVVIEQANWDTYKVREKLQRDIDAHVASVRAAKISELTSSYEEKLKESLSGPVEALLDGANSDTWPSIRNLLRRETESAVLGFSSAVSGFDMDEDTRQKMILSLEDYARSVVEGKAKEEAGRVLIRMKDKCEPSAISKLTFYFFNFYFKDTYLVFESRFTMLFSHDSDSMPRVWTGKEDIRAITKTARSASLKLLSVMAVIRLNDNDTDNIEKTLAVALVDSSNSAANKSITMVDPLASSTWEQEANKRSNNWLPPPWAIVALLPGIISLTSKFIPTIMNLMKKLAEEGQNPANNNPQRNQSKINHNALTRNAVSSSASSNVTSLDNEKEHSSPSKYE
ncbi:hypothetical protein Lal_00032093 [Lupinus albus]|nr:hypothetical protein Lal_00032093 [Lupinus albus]